MSAGLRRHAGAALARVLGEDAPLPDGRLYDPTDVAAARGAGVQDEGHALGEIAETLDGAPEGRRAVAGLLGFGLRPAREQGADRGLGGGDLEPPFADEGQLVEGAFRGEFVPADLDGLDAEPGVFFHVPLEAPGLGRELADAE